MQITFDTEKFRSAKGDHNLTNVLCYLKRHGCIHPDNYPSVEEITCRTPSSALRYCKYFASGGIGPEKEAIFLKNPRIAIRYLRLVGKSEFSDPKIQKRFRRKFRSNAKVACEWARVFNTRLTEDEESVFRKDMVAALDYAKHVIRGRFSEKVHGMIVLASFEDLNNYSKRCLSEYIKLYGN